MAERTLQAGTRMFFGAPATPMPKNLSRAISQVVAEIPGIVEAHLPQCFIEGDDEARQVLVIGVERRSEIPRIAQELGDRLQLVLPPENFMDILPFESGTVPSGARDAGCKIWAAEKRSWWKVW